MDPVQTAHRSEEGTDSFRWSWVILGIGLGAVLIGLFLFLVDPQLDRLDVAGYVLALALILSGIVVGRLSPGETIRETAVVGAALVVVTGILASAFLGRKVPFFVWMVAPLYAAPLTMMGGWVGEMLQGTLEESVRDETLDWQWVIVSVVIGLALSTFSVLLASARFGLLPKDSLWIMAISFLVTGLLVGYYSPGKTMIEPAIAAALMAVVNAGFIITWFGALPLGRVVVAGFGGAIVLAIIGGWAGEKLQDVVRGREPVVANPVGPGGIGTADGLEPDRD